MKHLLYFTIYAFLTCIYFIWHFQKPFESYKEWMEDDSDTYDWLRRG